MMQLSHAECYACKHCIEFEAITTDQVTCPFCKEVYGVIWEYITDEHYAYWAATLTARKT